MRTLGWVGLFLVIGLGTLKFAPDPGRAATAAECTRDFSAGFRSSYPPDMDRYIPLRKLKAASAKLCAGWMAYGREHPSAKPDDPASLAAAIHEKPATHVPLCAVSVQVDLAANAQVYRFVTKAERNRYQRDYCRLAATYMQPNSIAIDNARLAAEHPGLFAPFCASMVQDGAGPAVLAAYTRPKMQRITRRACLQALERGVIRCGSAGLTNAQIDNARFDAILQRQGL